MSDDGGSVDEGAAHVEVHVAVDGDRVVLEVELKEEHKLVFNIVEKYDQ